ncbi:receptor-type tyrosine-protein phosphatase C [Austrofundulus limnaeus]|uniref:Receptor-type tyrosine-protein phosphatase C n=1 Tax=Austrofundulus limnaeus TaxID=52670 RepID=A0A2I4B4W7_AUSLI|nr:PREDICTED: receptor-type tyrosine-protein phosphatase C-like [Austrofundulus limnaeus]
MNVECERSQYGFGALYNFKGPERIFIAHLVGHKEVNSSNCSFTFEDLSYVTTYKVEVIAFNGVFKSEPSIKEFKTSYHISFYIRLIIVPFSAVMPGVATFILNRKLKQINNDEKE